MLNLMKANTIETAKHDNRPTKTKLNHIWSSVAFLSIACWSISIFGFGSIYQFLVSITTVVAQHHLKTTEGKMKGTKEKGHHFPFFVEKKWRIQGKTREELDSFILLLASWGTVLYYNSFFSTYNYTSACYRCNHLSFPPHLLSPKKMKKKNERESIWHKR